jgi:hypothetical protein
MKRLFGWAFLALALFALYSVGGAVWRSMDFDSKFSGYVQNAVRIPPTQMERAILEIAIDTGITIEPRSLLIIPLGAGNAGYEVSCRYPVTLGIGGVAYVWHKEVIARTRLGGLAAAGGYGRA